MGRWVGREGGWAEVGGPGRRAGAGRASGETVKRYNDTIMVQRYNTATPPPKCAHLRAVSPGSRGDTPASHSRRRRRHRRRRHSRFSLSPPARPRSAFLLYRPLPLCLPLSPPPPPPPPPPRRSARPPPAAAGGSCASAAAPGSPHSVRAGRAPEAAAARAAAAARPPCLPPCPWPP